MLSIGNCILGEVPRVVAIIDEFFSAEKILSLKSRGADLLEMRIDCYSSSTESVVEYLEKTRTAVSLPMIGTVRENEWTGKKRVELFEAIMPFVDCIDLELGTPISDTVRSFAKDKVIIVSEHDFQKTPDESSLNDIVTRSVDQGADIVKIAVMADSIEDVRRLFWFTQQCSVPVVTIAMGAIGTVSRVIAPVFGSLFTYGYIDKPVAPGQLSVIKLLDELKLFFPGR